MQNTAMQQPAARPRHGNLPPRTASPGPLMHPRHQFAVDPATAGPSRPVAAQAATADLPKIKQGLDLWAQGAKAETPPPSRVEGLAVLSFGEPREQSIDAARAAVFKAVRSNAPSLEILHLQATGLPSEALGELRGLEHLALKSSLCRKLPDFTLNLATLSTLELKGNSELDRLPESIRMLKELKTLDIFNSPLMKSLPTGIGALPKLATLKLNGTSIRELPFAFAELSKTLQTLEISGPPSPRGINGLQKLPDNIGDFQSLTTLKLRYQEGLKELPASLGDLSKLETLDLSNCSNLKSLPDLSKLRNLKTLDLSWCSKLKVSLESLAKLPADCKITLADHWQQQKLNALRSGGTQPQFAATGSAGKSQSPPRSPKRPAAVQQTLEGWKAELKIGTGERGAERFNLWMGAMLDKHSARPDVKDEIQAVVKAAAESPVFRAELFALAATNVEVPRKFGIRQPDRATVKSTMAVEVRNLLLKHQVTDPQLNARQALGNLKKLAIKDTGFARELMPLAQPGAAGSPHAAVPPVLAAYVQAHDQDYNKILEARREPQDMQGGRSGHDDAEAHATALEVNDELLHGRYVAVAKDLMAHIYRDGNLIRR